MDSMKPPLFLDFEASCLPRDGRSFPIEVGLADGRGWARSWLIQPAPAWADWTWTSEAEALHGISRDMLSHSGMLPHDVLVALNHWAAGRDVYADHDLDRRWLATLADAAGIAPSFRLRHISEWIDAHGPSDLALLAAKAHADASAPTRHRAGWDAQWLATLALELEVPADDVTPSRGTGAGARLDAA
jgi:hypothetical protein